MSLQSDVNKILNDIENPNGSHVPVTFYDKAVYNEDSSKQAGHPVYETRVFVRKHKDNLSVYDSIARDEDFKQFPRQYESFLSKREQKESGVPIGMLPNITPAEVATCEACKIFTVEKLAQAQETVMLAIGNPDLKIRANEYLKGESRKDAEIAELKKKLEAYESINNGTKRSGRNATVRATNVGDKQREQGNEAVA
jgi:hypothetical protein